MSIILIKLTFINNVLFKENWIIKKNWDTMIYENVSYELKKLLKNT